MRNPTRNVKAAQPFWHALRFMPPRPQRILYGFAPQSKVGTIA
jgi:hypothetical protein